MNIQEFDILNAICSGKYINQRLLSEVTGHSLGIVNRSIKNLIKEEYLNKEIHLTQKALQEFEEKKPKNAIILAAGFGMRMVPINTEISKGLLEVRDEPLIERQIKQLHEAGITDISVIVGFMKEQYEYLIDEYGVKLIVNPDYATKNNLFSLKLVLKKISNTYIIPCDVWCEKNPFNQSELYSWYMVSDMNDPDSPVRVNRKMELVSVANNDLGNAMIGICYLLEEDASVVRQRLDSFSNTIRYEKAFWEETLYDKNKMFIAPRIVPSSEVVEINTYEQLRELDSNSNQLKSDALMIAARALDVETEKITNITVLKKGMTNRSFLFECCGQKYIMRIPGEGTDQLINRREEAQVYQAINEKGLCDDVIYINPENGYKITKFIESARVCNPLDEDGLKKCMRKLRDFHEMKLTVSHRFDLFKQIDFYESLWNTTSSIYKDYKVTKERVLSLKSYIEDNVEEEVLTHIDANADNFLFGKDAVGNEDIRLIDWEYAGMQDPHVDIAMFCIYSMYERKQVDNLIKCYFVEGCPDNIRIKIYCYIAVCGLLWSNWCEYKRQLGVDFGEYSLKQYRYAKDYYKIVQNELDMKK